MLTFYHCPWSRGSSIFWLLEELGVPYEMKIVDIRAPGGVPEDYRAIQPNKKVPAIVHDGTVVTERAAIVLYLTETFPEAGLAPKPGDPDRAPFLSWLVYADAVYDPAIAVKAHGWDYKPSDFSFGSYEDMVRHLEKTLSSRPYIAGDRFTAADTQMGLGVHYAINVLGQLKDRPVLADYLSRLSERPAFKRSSGKDYELAREAGMAG
ncbi:glutathione S-transferase family protein [Mesorhizobium sp. VNQ89]|uniref:glutathione S-transferase family protein n=1 Tax=Mesorhizobium quangtriensis TaxID=3157709 RepID=UPI0032B78629